MLKREAGDFKYTVLSLLTGMSASAEDVITTLFVWFIHVLYIGVMLEREAPVKELILIASVSVNKMAFLERGCGDLLCRSFIVNMVRRAEDSSPPDPPPDARGTRLTLFFRLICTTLSMEV